jgi:hypothetical protein
VAAQQTWVPRERVGILSRIKTRDLDAAWAMRKARILLHVAKAKYMMHRINEHASKKE